MPRAAVVGSTASGKSAVALEVARRLTDVQLVSVDSMQVYRGMDIGTAKPSPDDQRAVRHHCIDLVEPSEDFTVADFLTAHDRALASIEADGGRALLVGGTGLYHRVVIDRFELPGEWPEIRAGFEAEPDTLRLYEHLRELDPAAAAKIVDTNRRRIVRALEVTTGSGRPFSSFGPGVDSYPDTDIAQIGIRRPREVIADLVAERVYRMIDAGLVAEVTGLVERGMSRTAGQALGYKEIREHLEGRLSHDEAIHMIINRTRQFAVRQERWFRRDPRVRWIDVGDDPPGSVAPVVVAALVRST